MSSYTNLEGKAHIDNIAPGEWWLWMGSGLAPQSRSMNWSKTIIISEPGIAIELSNDDAIGGYRHESSWSPSVPEIEKTAWRVTSDGKKFAQIARAEIKRSIGINNLTKWSGFTVYLAGLAVSGGVAGLAKLDSPTSVNAARTFLAILVGGPLILLAIPESSPFDNGSKVNLEKLDFSDDDAQLIATIYRHGPQFFSRVKQLVTTAR